MKSRLLYILIVLVSLSTQARAEDSRYSDGTPLLFGIDMDYPPLEYVDKDGTPKGLDIVFTQEVMRRLNIPFTYSPNTWENISGDVLSGRVDLGMMVYSPYRKSLTNYSRAVFRLYYQILYRKNSHERFDLRSLSGKSVAYMSSRPIRDTLTKVGAVLNEVKNLSQATQDLSKGKYDAVICFRYQSSYMLKKYQIKNLTAEDLTLAPREYCYVSHDKNLIDSINVVLEKMEAEGYINEVYGEVSATFGGFSIPRWVWYLLVVLVIGFLLILIVFQQRYQKKLREEMIRAQRSERLKTVFLGNISHALRTPLNAIIGFSDVLDEDGGNMSIDDSRQLLHLINSNGKQLLYFINELLQLSDIETDVSPLQRSEVQVEEVMKSYQEECCKDLAKGVELRLEGEPVTIAIDERLMRMITKHFLSNAVKHTKRGSVTLRFKYIDKGLHVEVQDTGDGLPEALKKNIFSLLSDKATFIQDEVPGLGLTICKAIVDRYNGRIGVLSPEEGGTLMWYWIPVKKVTS